MTLSPTFKKHILKISKATSKILPSFLLRLIAQSGGHPLLPNGKTFIKSNYLGNYKVLIDPSYAVERAMCRNNYELKTCAFIKAYLKPDFICFDIGANVGPLSFVMAKNLENGNGKVYSFEPGPYYSRLEKNINMNPSLRNHIIPFNIAFGEKNEKKPWREDLGNLGNATLISNEDIEDDLGCNFSNSIDVEVITLDEFIDNHPEIQKVDFIKIDVEGMEYQVLLGAKKTLTKYKPIIYFETLISTEKFLRTLGYRLYNFDKNLIEVHYPNLPENTIAIY